MLRIAIVEDDPRNRDCFREYLNRFAEGNQLTIQVDCYSDGIELSKNYKPSFDIKWNGVNGAKIELVAGNYEFALK